MIHFVDSNSARQELIRGCSPVIVSGRIIAETWMQDAVGAVSSWYERVPWPSNISDGPSRLRFEGVRSQGVKKQQHQGPFQMGHSSTKIGLTEKKTCTLELKDAGTISFKMVILLAAGLCICRCI